MAEILNTPPDKVLLQVAFPAHQVIVGRHSPCGASFPLYSGAMSVAAQGQVCVCGYVAASDVNITYANMRNEDSPANVTGSFMHMHTC